MTGSPARLAPRPSRRPRLKTLAAGALIAAAVVLPGGAAAAAGPAAGRPAPGPRPTVVLVHGAWADSSSWSGVVQRLQRDGYPVRVFPTPLRGLAGDAAALRDYLSVVAGPVVLVGHSYGGAVVTEAADGLPAVKALVYVDAFAPAAGQRVIELVGPGSVLAAPDPSTVFDIVPTPQGPDLYVKQDLFPTAFAADVPAREGQVLAVTQRPVTLAALQEPAGPPAWAHIPAWYELGTEDRVIPPDAQAAMAATAGAHVVRVRSGHLPMVSVPGAVTSVVERAAAATG